MKLAVVSDIHGNLPALEAVLEDIEAEGVDQIVNLGDILSGPLQVSETAEFLMARDWVTIRGNHERQLLRLVDNPPTGLESWRDSDGYAATQLLPHQVDWLRGLPATHWLTPDVLMVHGTPGSDRVYWLETPDLGARGLPSLRAASEEEVRTRLENSDISVDRASLVLCGHSHVPRMMHCGDTLIVNPGSVGLQAYDGDDPHPHRMENGSPDARYAIVEWGRRGWQVRLCSVPYHFSAMAELAERNARPEWAYALTTGRMPPRLPTIGA
jgi:predicted phosphodiesterase